MMLKRSTHESKPKPPASGRSSRLVRAGLAGLAALSAVAGLATGCLDRPVVKATPTTSNVTDAVRKQMQVVGVCGNSGQPPCTDSCVNRPPWTSTS